jgi:autotransporter-associated beta strand protein
VISGTGSLLQLGSNTLTLTGNSTYTGGATVSAGTLQIGNGGTSGSIVGNVADNGPLAFDRSDTVAFGSVISGAGSLAQLGSGTLVLTGANTYSGGTTINAGTLQLGNGGTSGSIAGNVTDNGTLAFDRSDAVTFAGAISGTGKPGTAGQRHVDFDREQHLRRRYDDQCRNTTDWQWRNEWQHYRDCHRQWDLGFRSDRRSDLWRRDQRRGQLSSVGQWHVSVDREPHLLRRHDD